MRAPLLPVLFAGLLAFAAGRWSAADDEAVEVAPAPVRAQAYRIVWADSALDLSHGGGRWVHELFFPDAKLTATLVFETHMTSTDPLAFETRARVYVGRSDRARTDLTGLSESVPNPVEEVEVPAALAKAVVAFADLHDRYRADGERLGAEFTSALGLEPLEERAGPGAPPRDEPPGSGAD